MRNKIILILVVLVGLAVAIIVPNAIKAKDNEKSSNTFAKIKNIGRVIENYRTTRGILPTANEIMQAGAKDGWGNNFLYKLSSDKESCFLASPGKDGKFEGWTQRGTYYSQESGYFDKDTIYSDGRFVYSSR